MSKADIRARLRSERQSQALADREARSLRELESRAQQQRERFAAQARQNEEIVAKESAAALIRKEREVRVREAIREAESKRDLALESASFIRNEARDVLDEAIARFNSAADPLGLKWQKLKIRQTKLQEDAASKKFVLVTRTKILPALQRLITRCFSDELAIFRVRWSSLPVGSEDVLSTLDAAIRPVMHSRTQTQARRDLLVEIEQDFLREDEAAWTEVLEAENAVVVSFESKFAVISSKLAAHKRVLEQANAEYAKRMIEAQNVSNAASEALNKVLKGEV